MESVSDFMAPWISADRRKCLNRRVPSFNLYYEGPVALQTWRFATIFGNSASLDSESHRDVTCRG